MKIQTYAAPLVVVLFSTAIAVKCFFERATAYQFSPDEMMHLIIAGGDTCLEIARRSQAEVHPPLGGIFRSLFLPLGLDPVKQRSISFLIGMLGAAVLGIVTSRLSGPLLGSVAFAASLLSPISLDLNATVRNYSMVFALVSLLLLFVQMLNQSQTAGRSTLLSFFPIGVTATLLALTHLSGLFFIAILPFSLLASAPAMKFLTKKFLVPAAIGLTLIAGLIFTQMMLPDSTLSGWLAFFQTAPGAPLRSISSLPLLSKIISVYYSFFTTSPTLIILFFALSLFGVIKLVRLNRALAMLVMGVFALMILVSAADLYPLVGNRYCYHLLPLLILGTMVGLNSILKLFGRHTQLASVPFCFAALLWLTVNAVGHVGRKADEFPLTRTGSEQIARLLAKHQGQTVLTNRITALTALYLQEGVTGGYQKLRSGEYQFNGTNLVFDPREFFWEYRDEKLFFSWVLQALPLKKAFEAKEVPVLIGAFSDYTLLALLKCSEIIPFIQNDSVVTWVQNLEKLQRIIEEPSEQARCFQVGGERRTLPLWRLDTSIR